MEECSSDLDDEALLRGIQKGSHEAFSSLVRRHAKRFYNVAYRVVQQREDAEDLVQAAFLKLWERPDLWDPRKHTKFTTWFYAVVTNLCLDHAKRKKPGSIPEGFDVADGRPDQGNVLQHKQERNWIEQVMRTLPERQQLALNLCFYEGLSNQEAADIMGVNLKALQSLIMRAKATLKERVRDSLVTVPNGDGH
jgi:RNA polymerase sigma-70 factor (ECF subfamily)